MGFSFAELTKKFTLAIRDPLWKHVGFSQEILDLTRTEPFLRLSRIKQLGPTEFVYPGATHTRASHSIGVYCVAQKILKQLSERGADSWITSEGALSFLIAALLHDLGHFPYTHSLKELPLQEHEDLTAQILLQEPLYSAIGKAGANPECVASIIAYTSTDAETNFFKHLLSGVLDPDKIDYLNRDAYFCGVPYGIQDTDFIISQLYPDKTLGIVLDTKGILPVENILFSKYLMYRSVYWHKQVRIATAMMKKSLYALLTKKLLMPEQLYSCDDTELYRLLKSINSPDAQIGIDLLQRALYKVVGEFKPSSKNLIHTKIEELSKRTEIEYRISEMLSKETGILWQANDVLLDLPEKISFETNLFIQDEGVLFAQSSTVFSSEVVKGFTESLRVLRVAVHPQKSESLEKIANLSEKLAKCIELD